MNRCHLSVWSSPVASSSTSMKMTGSRHCLYVTLLPLVSQPVVVIFLALVIEWLREHQTFFGGLGGGGNVSFVPQLLNWYTGSHWIRNLNFSVFLYLYLQEEKIHLCHLLYKVWQKKLNFNIFTLIFSPWGKIHPCQQFFVTFSNI